MNKFYRMLWFVLSFLVLFIILFISYKIGKKGGIKKALYRITYISICVLVSFIVAPYLTEFILNFNLYPHGLAIHYKGLNFYRLIDFIEEVIVHSDVLNDVYNLIPNLKNLLMDFPQIIFIPITYLLSFLLLMLFFLPIYLYLGYRRKRRVLYDVNYKKSGKVFAGLLTCIEIVFIISITLTPVNGLARIYSDSKENILSDSTNICEQNPTLGKYKIACTVAESYNSTIFKHMGDNYINRYVYNSLTQIKYNDKRTNLNDEILTIAQAGMVLNKTGLLEAINSDFNDFKDFEDFSRINFKELTSEEIDIIINAFENSLYTKEILDDLYAFVSSYLNYLLKLSFNMQYDVNLTHEELVNELKIVLTAANSVLNDEKLLDSVNKVYGRIDKFIKLPYKQRKNTDNIMRLMFNVAYDVDVDSILNVYDLLKDSKIYRTLVPRILDSILSEIGVRVNINANPNELDEVIIRIFGIVKIIQNHKYVNNVIAWLAIMSQEEWNYIADFLEYIANSETMNYMLYDFANFGVEYGQLKLNIPTELLFEITDWRREMEFSSGIMQIVYKALYYDSIDFDKALYLINNYKDSVIFDYGWKFAIDLLPEAFKTWIAGKGLRYLVGEYV